MNSLLIWTAINVNTTTNKMRGLKTSKFGQLCYQGIIIISFMLKKAMPQSVFLGKWIILLCKK